MHVTDVKVTQGTDGFSSVRFLGQGGESIEVRLADAEGGGADPVARARAIMTQVASFELVDQLGRPLEGGDRSAAAAGGLAGPPMGGDAEPARGPASDVWSRPEARTPPLLDREQG